MELTMTPRTYRHLIKKHSEDFRSTSGLLKYVCRELRAFVSLYIRPKCLCTCQMNMFLKKNYLRGFWTFQEACFAILADPRFPRSTIQEGVVKAIYGAHHDYQDLPSLNQ